MKEKILDKRQIDILQELINIGAGRGADVLNSFLNSHIKLSIPEVRVLTPEGLHEHFTEERDGSYSSVEMRFSGSISGAAELIFLSEKASKLVELITGEHTQDHDFDALKAATFSEVGNIIINAVLGAISNELTMKLDFTIPHYIEGPLGDLFSILENEGSKIIVVAKTRFLIEKTEIEGSIAIFFGLRSFGSFTEAVDRYI